MNRGVDLDGERRFLAASTEPNRATTATNRIESIRGLTGPY
jgi:hypothetical protein